MQSAQTEDFLNGSVAVVFNLLEPPLDVCKRIDPTHIIDYYNAVCPSIESDTETSIVAVTVLTQH